MSLQPFPARSQEQHGRGAPVLCVQTDAIISARNESSKQPSTEAAYGRKAMNWFSRTTSIAGIQVSNWMMLVIAALVAIWIIYSFVAH
jgi:hypothetical protein